MRYDLPKTIAVLATLLVTGTAASAALYSVTRDEADAYEETKVAYAPRAVTAAPAVFSSDDPEPRPAERRQRKTAIVSPGYFRALGWLSPSPGSEERNGHGSADRCPTRSSKA